MVKSKIIRIIFLFIIVFTECLSYYNKVQAESLYTGSTNNKCENNQNGYTKGGTCPLDVIMEAQTQEPVYEVYSPIGTSAIKPITQAQRLSTLNEKTIAIVGGSFMANVTHPEIKRLILKNYPTAKVILLNEIGSAGPYSVQGVKKKQIEEFQRKLREMKVDAVISGNGGCGLCTPKEEGSCIAAEYIGIPSVMIAASGFAEQAKSTATIAGVPVQRVAEYPGAFTSHSHDDLIQNTRNILWKQIIDGLTKPITDNEKQAASKETKTDSNSIAFSGTLSEVQKYFEEHGCTDGLPVIPPTEQKVNEFLKYTPYDKNSIIGSIPPSYREVTVFNIAVTGAMAGCPPEYMPILIAYTKAMLNSDFRKTLSSTHAWTPFVWINGPISRQLGIDCGQGEISSPQNKKIGRFIDLAMINLAGYDIKKNRMGTFGYLSSWAMSEDEEAVTKIGWQPYHVQKGFNINENTLTATSSLNWGNNLTPASSDTDKIVELMAWDIAEKEQFAIGSGTPFVYRTIFITEYVAKDLAKKYKDKGSLEQILIQTARRPLEERAYANYWANPGSSFEGKNYSVEQHKVKISQEENAQITNIPKWLSWTGKNQIQTVPVMKQGKTAIILTGDANRNKVLTVPGGGMATIKIDLPNNWDDLMKDLGYKPLSSYYLKSTTPINITNTKPQENKPNLNSSETKRPSAEKYRKIRQEQTVQNTNTQYRSSFSNYQPRRSNYGQYGKSNSNGQRRPSAEQYRKIRQQQKIH